MYHGSKNIDFSVNQKINDFFEMYPTRTLSNGDILVQAGEEPEGVMYLIDGQIGQYDVSDSGTKVTVNVFKPPAFFPMSWAINDTPNIYFFEAVGDTKLTIAPRDDAVDFIKQNPDVMLDLLSRVYRGTDGLLRKSAHLMGGSAQTRLCFGLVVRAKRFGKKSDDGSVIINISETELASEIGLTRETVNRELKKLKDTGLISVSTKTIVVKSLEDLELFLDSRL